MTTLHHLEVGLLVVVDAAALLGYSRHPGGGQHSACAGNHTLHGATKHNVFARVDESLFSPLLLIIYTIIWIIGLRI